MACDRPELIDYGTNFEFFDLATCWYFDTLGAGLSMYIFAGATAIALYAATGSVWTPIVIGIVTGGVLFALLPAAGSQVALILIVLGAGVAMYLLARRTALSQ